MSGAGFFKYDGETPETSFSCRGREAFQDLLNGNPALRKEIEKKVLDSIKEETAKALGIDEIKVGGKAKEVRGDSIVLSSDEEDEADPEGPGMPIQDDED